MIAPEDARSALYRHILLVGQRPRIYLGGHGADMLAANLYGWKAHRHNHPDGDDWADAFFAKFDRFVADQFGDERTIEWQAIVKKREPDPRRQLSLFYELLENFCGAYRP